MKLDHERLDVYQVSLDFAAWSYELAKQLRGVDRHSRDQLLRASQSITLNIAEGCGRTGDPELRRFCLIAMGLASELEYHLLLAYDLKYLEPSAYRSLEAAVTEVKRMLASLIAKLKD